MNKRLVFPIRMRILVTLLLVVTSVVSIITYVMANLFHEDKTTYINDLASVMAQGTAQECGSLLLGYEEKLRICGRIMASAGLAAEERSNQLDALFSEFRDLIAVIVRRDGEEYASVYDSALLDRWQLSKADLETVEDPSRVPEATRRGEDAWIRNSTVHDQLPTLSMVTATATDSGEPLLVEAVIRLESLQRIAARSGAFDLFLVDADGTFLAHRDSGRAARRERPDLPGELRELGAYGSGATLEYDRDDQRVIGGFAMTTLGNVVAGVEIPRSAAYLASRDLLRSLVIVASVLLAIAAFMSLFGSRRITRPIERLVGATREIAQGKFDVAVEVRSGDEIGALAHSINHMAVELKNRETELHEAQAQLVQSEKMAAFGQLGAGIAHEVKNPLAGILGITQLLLRKSEEGSRSRTNLELIEKETKRCKSILENMLRFARQEKSEMTATAVDSVIDDAAAIVRHQLELHRVKLVIERADNLPSIRGNANQLQQVFMNIMMNAQQAMDEEGGTVTVTAAPRGDDHVEVRIADDGPGIPRDVQNRLFEPFFTTKPGGKGTGLGLSVSYGIVADHGGEISVESSPGEGAAFVMVFPAAPADRVENDAPALVATAEEAS